MTPPRLLANAVPARKTHDDEGGGPANLCTPMYSNLKSRLRAAQSAVPIYPAAAATPLFCVLCTQ